MTGPRPFSIRTIPRVTSEAPPSKINSTLTVGKQGGTADVVTLTFSSLLCYLRFNHPTIRLLFRSLSVSLALRWNSQRPEI